MANLGTAAVGETHPLGGSYGEPEGEHTERDYSILLSPRTGDRQTD